MKNKKPGIRVLLLAAFSVLAMHGCAGGPPKDIVLQGDLIASPSINPNREGRPSPVTIVIFHLKNADTFLAQDFFNLYSADSGVLAADLIQRTDIQIQPGQTLPIGSKFDPETTHIGVLAAFRDIGNASWRALVPLPQKSLTDKINPFSEQKLIVTVDELAVTAEVREE